MNNIVKRVVAWNSVRYKQEFDYELSRDLLLEELNELFEAKNVTEKVDAIGDLVFVGIGILWKLGMPVEAINAIMYDRQWSAMDEKSAFDWLCTTAILAEEHIDMEQKGAWVLWEMTMNIMLFVCLGQLRVLKMESVFYDIILAICNSNDTKEIVKTESNIKANIKKGEDYVPPTQELRKIINLVYAKDW